jgi:CheY-like chemotaxis protein/HPt (histidine-containing phosphotransfer) domain-containing protein
MDATANDQLQILVVDDDELNQRMMRLILTRDGHHVHVASNGLDALRIVGEHDFDIILMDLQMPVMGGVEASLKIRESENGGKYAYIVALTASYMPEKGSELFAAGIDNYLSKPFDVEHLHQMLRYGLDYRQSRLSAQYVKPEQGTADESAKGLDFEMGIKLVGGDQEVYRELLSDFIERLPEKYRNIEKCYAEKDMEGLARAVHNIKGVSANLAVLQLSEYAGILEKMANEGYTPSIGRVVIAMKEITHKVIAAASSFLSSSEVK